jgi:putative ATPase
MSRPRRIDIDLASAQETIQPRAMRYDKGGDEHYNTICAFIKSVRGSAPDAALYWLATALVVEDPESVMRRLTLAGEDIGLPERKFHLALATVYLATAPKSNSMTQSFEAERVIQEEGQSGDGASATRATKSI